MANYNPQMDDVLAGMAQSYGGLEDFLGFYSRGSEASPCCRSRQHFLGGIFSFFERRTDLFHVMQKKDDAMGFPPGVAENMVLTQFKKCERREEYPVKSILIST